MKEQIHHEVFWQLQGDSPAKHPVHRLEKDATADTVVVGAGMAGLACAHKLRESGQSVIVLERDRCGAGASGKTSGFITPDSELELNDLVRTMGAEEAKRLWAFVTEGLESIRHTIETGGIECDYQVQDSLFIANTKRAFRIVESEHAARIKLGYDSHLYHQGDIASAIGSQDYSGGVRYPGTFGMNSFLLCRGMKAMLESKDVTICEDTAVTAVTPDGVRTARGHTVRAKNAVICTDRFLPELGILPQDVYHAQTFLAISRPLSDADTARMFPDKRLMVWDTDLIYQYFRITGDNRLLLGAASVLYTYDRHERTTPKSIIAKMHAYLRRKFPWLSVELEYVWPGLIGVSKDFLPIVGRDTAHPHVLYASAAAGLPWAAAIGRYLADKILDGRSDFDAILSPNRRYPTPRTLQRILGTPKTFALSHGFVKYFR